MSESPFSNFTSGKPFVVSAAQASAAWGGARGGALFRCAWCGHKFREGDTARWVFTNGGGEETRGIGGNPFVCAACDAPREELIGRLREMRALFETKFWWFTRHSHDRR